jgi:hypothetical protein
MIILDYIEKKACFFFDTPEFLHALAALTQRTINRE